MKISNFFSNPPALAKYLFIILAAVLVIMAFMSFKRVDSTDIEQTIQYATRSFMMFIDAALMLLLAFMVSVKNKLTYQLAVVILALNIILTIFNQFDFLGIVFILLNAFALYVLIKYRDEFTDSAAG